MSTDTQHDTMNDGNDTIPLDDAGSVRLPIVEILTGRGFITGKSGSGKSNSASVVVEELLDRGFPVLIVDTDGEYWGLKEEYEILHVADCSGTNLSSIKSGPVTIDLSRAFARGDVMHRSKFRLGAGTMTDSNTNTGLIDAHWTTYPMSLAFAVAMVATVTMPVKWYLHGFEASTLLFPFGMALTAIGLACFNPEVRRVIKSDAR